MGVEHAPSVCADTPSGSSEPAPTETTLISKIAVTAEEDVVEGPETFEQGLAQIRADTEERYRQGNIWLKEKRKGLVERFGPYVPPPKMTPEEFHASMVMNCTARWGKPYRTQAPKLMLRREWC